MFIKAISKLLPGKGKDDRRIFKFHDGQRKRSADPLAAWCCLHDDPAFVIDRDLRLVDAGDSAALKITTAAVRRAFNLKPWSETDGGMTEAECLALLATFMEYMNTLKKNSVGMQTSPLPLESNPLAELTTNAESDSSKTSSEPSIDTQSESGAASA
jgi:hypothetical protein